MTKLNQVLIWLSGKKSILSIILMALNTYLVSKGIYGELEFTLITTSLVAIFGVAGIQTQRAYKEKK